MFKRRAQLKELIMKRTLQVVAVSVLMFAAHGVALSAHESPYPADAEASWNLPALATYADQQARKGNAPAEAWGVSKRQAPKPHNPFPFGGGYNDD
jgi:hypothetical protein